MVEPRAYIAVVGGSNPSTPILFFLLFLLHKLYIILDRLKYNEHKE